MSNPFEPNQKPTPPVNPYASPSAPSVAAPPSNVSGHYLGPGSMVRQVPVIGGLMIAQGALVILVGGGLGVFSLFMGAMVGGPGNPTPGMSPNELLILQIVYGIFGLVGLLAGIMNVYAGIQLIRYKNRILALISMGIGLFPVLYCYCAPTAIGLMIYGYIILLNTHTKLAFQLQREGHSKIDVLRKFY